MAWCRSNYVPEYRDRTIDVGETMKNIIQFEIILAFSFVGEILNRIIPLPVPASIYGMILLFIALCTGLIKLSAVRETGKFLIYIMPMMFIPPVVGLLDNWAVMKDFIVAILVISLISTLVVLAVSGRVTQYLINRKKGEGVE